MSHINSDSNSTWLLNYKKNGFAALIFVILEVLHAVILIFVGAIHSVSIVENCRRKIIKQNIKKTYAGHCAQRINSRKLSVSLRI